MEKKHTQKDLETAVERMAIGGNNTFAACFDNFINLALSFFCNNCDERQMHLRKYMEENENFKQAYIDALNAFADLAEDYHDPVGDMFMDKISHGQHGQFFTPDDLCVLCADILGIGDGNTVSVPCCGSGRMLLAALKNAREVDGNEPKLYANDLSLTCAKMTLLNFCVNSVDGEVTCGDTLKLDYENFIFFKLDKVRNIESGKVLSTYWQYTKDTVEEVQEKRKKWWMWIAEHGWIKYYHFKPTTSEYEDFVAPPLANEETETVEVDADKFEFHLSKYGKQIVDEYEKLPTEVKVGENNQYELF